VDREGPPLGPIVRHLVLRCIQIHKQGGVGKLVRISGSKALSDRLDVPMIASSFVIRKD
jgi:hypothetical protein